MQVIENCTSLDEPKNQFKSYEIIIVSNVIKNETNYNYTQTIYNPLEYEEYKFNNLNEKDKQINELSLKNEDLQNKNIVLQNNINTYGEAIDIIMTDIIPNVTTV